MTKKYEAVVLGSCNLEMCVDDPKLAEKLLKDYPDGNRKLYPIVRKVKDGYLVEPTEKFPIELFISDEQVTRVLAAGGGANVAKVLSKLDARPVLLTSVGSENDPAYPVIAQSLKEEPVVDFIDLSGRPKVGLTLNVYGGGLQSTLLISFLQWQAPELEKEAKQALEKLDPMIPMLAIANSRPYLPLLNGALDQMGFIEYFCPSRDHISGLKSGDERFFKKAKLAQGNVAEWIDIYRWASQNPGWKPTNNDGILYMLSSLNKIFGEYGSYIATNSERGGCFLKREDIENVYTYNAYPIPGKFVDDTGCGDIFAGAFFWSHLLKKRSFEASIEFAAACATFPIPSVGATGRLATQKEVENWIKQHGPRIQK